MLIECDSFGGKTRFHERIEKFMTTKIKMKSVIDNKQYEIFDRFDLPINGDDLLALGIQKDKLSTVLQRITHEAFHKNISIDRESVLAHVKKEKRYYL